MIRVNGNIKTGLEISAWLKEQGHKHTKDFTWYIDDRLGLLAKVKHDLISYNAELIFSDGGIHSGKTQLQEWVRFSTKNDYLLFLLKWS